MRGAAYHHTTLFPVWVLNAFVVGCVESPFLCTSPVIGSVGGMSRAWMGCGAAGDEDLFSLRRRPDGPTAVPHVKVEVVRSLQFENL